jgi:hypothetical protein
MFGEPNPLLDLVPMFNDPKDLHAALTHNPLKDVDVSKLNFMQKKILLATPQVMLKPTTQTLMAALTWYSMMVGSLGNRNPLRAENRRLYWEALNADPNRDKPFAKPLLTGISANVFKGPAGTGKTVTYQHFSNCFQQVIEHGRNDAAGWVSIKQLVYFHVDMSHDGSRKGFLTAILMKLDSLLGTDYGTTLPRAHKTVETLAVATIQRLLAHFTGIIFIDEIQLRNLVKNSSADLMQTFLLSLINSGIPIVLTGNERAMDWVSYSQDITRLLITNPIHAHPIGALDEPGWEADWNAMCDRGVMRFYLLDEPVANPAACSEMLYRCSGGVARLAHSLWTQAQSHCLITAKPMVAPEDIEAVFNSIHYDSIRNFVNGFHFKNADLLTLYPDVDSNFYRRHWQPSLMPSDSHIGTITAVEPPTTKKKPPRTLSEQSKFKSQETRKKTTQAHAAHLKRTLSPDDMRREGHVQNNLNQLMKLKDAAES